MAQQIHSVKNDKIISKTYDKIYTSYNEFRNHIYSLQSPVILYYPRKNYDIWIRDMTTILHNPFICKNVLM